MLTLKLAVRNILGAGLKTWLNVIALSFSFLTIIFLRGVYDGMSNQAEEATIDAAYGGGQYWQAAYDPFDPMSLEDAHDVLPGSLLSLIGNKQATPILIRQAAVYPQGRFRSVLLKGIEPDQNVLTIPSEFLEKAGESIPALIGTRMAKSTGLRKGDFATVQWRDVDGTFDARDVRIVEVFSSTVQDIDNNQFWVPLSRLQEITNMPGQATIVVMAKGARPVADIGGWQFRDLSYLLSDFRAMVRSKRIGGSIMYLILLSLAMLAIFDTQVLSIFRRKKEMGTLMALGMTRPHLVGLFTLEGAFHAVFAAIAAALYGIPLLAWFASTGWPLPEGTDNFGFALGERIFPAFSAGLVVSTTLLVLVVTTIVSYLPTRKITRLKPTDALRGRMT